MLAAVGAGMNRWPLARMKPVIPISHRTPATSAVCFQSSTPLANLIERSITKPISGTYSTRPPSRAPIVASTRGGADPALILAGA
jgi:hypothetical protein